MASVDAVFFDLDETLLDDATSYDIAISRGRGSVGGLSKIRIHRPLRGLQESG
jgi:FMN phosphatase YigB (HAD superfamily)